VRYPTRDGLILPPYELGFTIPDSQAYARRNTQNHHGYFPRRAYDENWRRVFRNLLVNVYPMLSYEHNGIDSLHDSYAPPRMPKDSLMIDVIEEELATHSVIALVHEKRTNESYHLDLEKWEHIRRSYESRI
jgi:hypothetical protein